MTKESVCVVRAGWHNNFIQMACDSFAAGLPDVEIEEIPVPGAFEMPLMVQRVASLKKHSLFVCFALVVDGGIYQHEFVATSVVNALLNVQLKVEVPVLSVVLSPHEFREGGPLGDFFGRHLGEKGREAAEAARRILEVYGERF